MLSFLLASLAFGTSDEHLKWGGPSNKATSVRNTTSGKVQGLMNTGDGREMFMGIPFAAPPTGENRFRAPQTAPSWSGVKKVDTYSSKRRCLSIGQTGGREDCLYLDVHVPGDASEGEELPVWVWIYGGGFIEGSKNGGGMYDPTPIMNQHRVVFVAANYRLDLFGFMAHPAFESESESGISSGNYGLLDQSFALEWVQKNIKNFNGDKSNVMIFGQSAGGMSVDFHIVSEKASKGLFKTAISMSGAPDVAFWQPKEVANDWALDWTKNIDCGESLGAEKIRDCLRALDADELMAQKLPHPSKLSLLYPLFGWVPTIDGYYLTDTPTGMVEAGNWNKVPSMFGVEKDEGSAFTFLLGTIVKGSGVPVTWSDLKSLSEIMIPFNKTKQEMAYEHYYKAPSQSWNMFAGGAATEMITDSIFRCSNRRIMRAIAKQNIEDAPAYYYYTNYDAPLMVAWQALGDFHGFDLVHVFEFDVPETQVWTPDNSALAKFYRESFFQFAQYGNPGHYGWERYTLEKELGIAMDGYFKPLDMNHHDPQCDFWDEIGPNLWTGKGGYSLVPKKSPTN